MIDTAEILEHGARNVVSGFEVVLVYLFLRHAGNSVGAKDGAECTGVGATINLKGKEEGK
jgi:hypothetical protein